MSSSISPAGNGVEVLSSEQYAALHSYSAIGLAPNNIFFKNESGTDSWRPPSIDDVIGYAHQILADNGGSDHVVAVLGRPINFIAMREYKGTIPDSRLMVLIGIFENGDPDTGKVIRGLAVPRTDIIGYRSKE
jgi:hypothetical protein